MAPKKLTLEITAHELAKIMQQHLATFSAKERRRLIKAGNKIVAGAIRKKIGI